MNRYCGAQRPYQELDAAVVRLKKLRHRKAPELVSRPPSERGETGREGGDGEQVPVVPPSQNRHHGGGHEHDPDGVQVHGARPGMATGPLAGGGREQPGHDRGRAAGDVYDERGEEHRAGVGHVDADDIDGQHVVHAGHRPTRAGITERRYIAPSGSLSSAGMAPCPLSKLR